MTTPACGPEPPLLPPDSLSSSSSPLNPPDSLYSPPSQSLSVPPVRRKPLPANNAASSLSLPRRSGLSPPALTPTAGETPEHPRRPPDDRPIPVQPPLSPVSFAPSSSSLVDEAFLSGPRDLVRSPQSSPSAPTLHLDTVASTPSTTDDDVGYGAQFSNENPLHSRLVSEPFIPVLPSPPAMALHPPPNRPPPLRIDSAGARKASATSFELKQNQPKTPGNKISSFFGWKAPVTSPGAESSSTEISEGGRSPLASPMPPSFPSGSYAITPSTNIPFDASSKPARNGYISIVSILDTKLADLEIELREISSELAGSFRREL